MAVTWFGASLIDGMWQVRGGGQTRPVRRDGQPVMALAPGWRAIAAFDIDPEMTLLELGHEDGRRAAWFLDDVLNLRTNAWAELPEALRAAALGAARRSLSEAGGAVFGAAPPRPIDAAEAACGAVLASDARLLATVLPLICPPAAVIALENDGGVQNPASLAAVERLIGRAADAQALRGFFRQDLLDVHVAAAGDGAFTMPHPLDGRPMRSDHAWCLGGSGIALNLPGAAPEDRCVAVMFGFQMTLFGVYFPHHNMMLHLNERHRAECERLLGGGPSETGLWRQMAQQADRLVAHAAATRRPALLVSYDHIGHHLWNELAGLDAALTRLGAAAMPQVIVANPEATEIYGPMEAIFPELAGRVQRAASQPLAAQLVHEGGYMPLRASGIRIGRGLAERIATVADRRHMPAATQRTIAALQAKGFRFVVLGLRVENRTLVEFPAFCEDLVEMLAGELGRVVVIVDGQNVSEGGFRYRVTFQQAETASALAVEEEIAARLTARFAADPNVVVLSTIGAPVGASLALCAKAAFFVTPWGAGLAKYRWICNLPGLALAGPSCERLQPVHLYDDPRWMEAPGPMHFMPPGTVEDAPDDPVLMPGGNADRVNIRVRPEALLARLREMIAALPAAAKPAP